MQINETKWNKYYDLTKIPENFNPDRTLYGVLKDSATKYGDRIAIEYGFTKISYSRLLEIVDRVASKMVEVGMRAGDIVTLSHSGMPGSVVTVYASSKIGMAVSSINNALTGVRLREIVNITGSRNFFVSNWKLADFVDFFNEVEENVTLYIAKTKDYTKTSFRLRPQYHRFMVRDMVNAKKNITSDKVTIYNNKTFLSQGGSECEACSDADAPAVLFHSGSATGSPYPVEASSKALNYKVFSYSYIINQVREGDKPLRVFSCVKQSFSFGLTMSVHTSLAMGDTIILNPDAGYSTPDWEIAQFKPDVIIGYPSICAPLMESRILSKKNLSFVKLVVSTGESMTGALYNELNDYLKNHGSNAPIYRLYGLTESLSAVCFNPPEFDNDRIIGIPLPGVNMKILDRETGREMPTGIKGEICISYAGNMSCYYNNPEITSEVMKQFKDGRTWLCTGDYGKEDENGVFTFEGHSKRVLDMGGVHIYPELIEEEIKGIYGVNDCCIVPVTRDGNVSLTAVVVPIDDFIADNDRLEELNQNILDITSKVFFDKMRPSKVEFRIYLPQKNGGETDYETLTKQMNLPPDEEVF